MHALDRAKRLQGALGKLAERRDRQIEKANGEFRLDLLAVIDTVDDETVGLVLRGLAIDREQHYLQLSLQLALDERNERKRGGASVETRRSGSARPPPLPTTFDPHEAETDVPPPSDEVDAAFDLVASGGPGLLPTLPASAYPPGGVALPVQVEQSGTVVLEGGETMALGELRYPEPGEPAVTLADGTVVAAP